MTNNKDVIQLEIGRCSNMLKKVQTRNDQSLRVCITVTALEEQATIYIDNAHTNYTLFLVNIPSDLNLNTAKTWDICLVRGQLNPEPAI